MSAPNDFLAGQTIMEKRDRKNLNIWERVEFALEHLVHQTQLLVEIKDNTEAEEAEQEYRRVQLRVDCNAAGAGEATFDALAGTALRLLKFSATAPVGATGVFLFYIASSAIATNLIHVEPSAQYTGHEFGAGDYVPEHNAIVVRCESMPANATIFINVAVQDYVETRGKRFGKETRQTVGMNY